MTDPRPATASQDARTLAASWLEEHGDVLYRYALARVGRAETAEDLVQDTLVAGIEGWSRFEGGSKVRTWLVGILRHKILDELRRRSREPAWLEEVGTATSGESPGFRDGYWRDPQEAWSEKPRSPGEGAELRAMVRECLAAMPEPMRLAFTLREMDGMESSMVCEVLGVTPTNLWTLVHRAKLRLRSHIGRHWYGVGRGDGS